MSSTSGDLNLVGGLLTQIALAVLGIATEESNCLCTSNHHSISTACTSQHGHV
jgi:hypothetical protein